jgi:hypothetical protein
MNLDGVARSDAGKKPLKNHIFLSYLRLNHGAPGEGRTHDLQLRRLTLYPSELRARSTQEDCIRLTYTLRFRYSHASKTSWT